MHIGLMGMGNIYWTKVIGLQRELQKNALLTGIAWCGKSHLFYNEKALQSVPIGKYICNSFMDQTFSLAWTSYFLLSGLWHSYLFRGNLMYSSIKICYASCLRATFTCLCYIGHSYFLYLYSVFVLYSYYICCDFIFSSSQAVVWRLDFCGCVGCSGSDWTSKQY